MKNLKKFLQLFLSLIITMCLLSMNVISQESGLYWQNPTPQNNSLYCVFIIDNSTAAAAGENGIFLKTTEAGRNWNVRQLIDSGSFKKVQFTNSFGWLLGENDILLNSTDEGETWEKIDFENIKDLNSFCFVDDSIGFLGANGGSVYKTTNSGENWNKLSVGDSLINIDNIFFIDSLYGWLLGRKDTSDYFRPVLMKTIDGGKSWLRKYSSYFYNNNGSVQFINNKIGWIAQGNNTILKTIDGGETWKQIIMDTYFHAISIYFNDENNGIAVGDRNKTFYSNDGGITWTSVSLNYSTIKSFNSIYTYGNLSIAVGDAGYITISTDKGKTWNNQTRGVIQDFHFIKALSKDTAFTLGINVSYDKWPYSWYTFMYKTINNGTSWITIYKWNNVKIEACEFLNTKTGWAVGNGIYKTTDGGINWNKQNTDSTIWLYSIDFIDSLTAWSVGLNGEILKTTDGGTNWIKQSSSTTLGLLSVNFVNKDLGWISGEQGIVLKTENGGDTWASQIVGNENTLRSIFFINNNIGFTAGNGFYKTTDGGNNWLVKYNSDSFIRSIQFTTTYTGYGCGLNGLIIKTTDGGDSWFRVNSKTNKALTSLSFIDSVHGLFAGDLGTILKTENGIVTSVYNNSDNKEFDYPKDFSLSQNYPNPFNPSTTIKYSIPNEGTSLMKSVQLKLYDILGREVATLINEKQNPGTYHCTISIINYKLSSGVYFYQLRAGNFIETKKMVVIK